MNKTLTSRLTRAVFVAGTTLFSALLWQVAHIPSTDDALVADQLGKLMATGYGRFPDRHQVEHQGHGQIYYSHPGAFAKPTVDLYEVTSPDDVERLEAAARRALAPAHAHSVTLRFFEKENQPLFASGGRSHAGERLIKTEVIQADAV